MSELLLSELLFPLDSAAASRVTRSSSAESPEEAAAMGDVALSRGAAQWKLQVHAASAEAPA